MHFFFSHKRLPLTIFSCLSFALLLATGCSGGSTGTVEGTVSVNGAPVNGLEVEFTRVEGGGPAMAYTVNGGKYNLIVGRGNDQIPIGEYKVAIRVFSEDPTLEIPKFKLGPNYTKTEETELRGTVKSGTNTLDFDLNTKK